MGGTARRRERPAKSQPPPPPLRPPLPPLVGRAKPARPATRGLMRPEASARRERFAERGGVEPADAEGRALLEAILGSEHLTNLLLADVAALPALAADPYLR